MKLEVYHAIGSIPSPYLEQLSKFDTEWIIEFVRDPFTFNIGIVIEEDLVIGVGLIRVVNEFKMCLNPTITNFKKAKALTILLGEAFYRSQCKEIVVEITKGEDHYINILKEHYNFYETSGKVLRLEK